MRKLLFVLGVLAMISPVLATPMTTFTETWEDDTASAPPLSPWNTDAHWSSCWVVTGSTYNHTAGGTKGYIINNSGFNGTDHGDQALIVPSGKQVNGTNASPLVATYWLKSSLNNRSDYYFEISLGDYHAPIKGVEPDPANPIPVIAYCMPKNSLTEATKTMFFFNGKTWTSAGSFDTNNTWEQMGISIDVDSAIVTTSIGPSSNDLPLLYLGGYDRLSINTRNFGNTTWGSIDDIVISGGDVIPEPATVVLLGLGLMFLRRRTA